MSEIRPLSAQDLNAATQIFVQAYPGTKIESAEEREAFQERFVKLHQEDPTANAYGLFRQGRMLGLMILYDLIANFLGVRLPTGGVGQVAVDLLYKREHVAKEMIAFFLRHYRQRGISLAALYPFRPDFYRAMGFGYGPKISQYRVEPAAFPRGPSKAHLRTLGLDDKEAIVDCYNRLADRTHGMIYKTEREMRGLFRNEQSQIVGCERDGRLRGYLVYTFEHGDSFLLNDLHVREWISETPEALSELLTFLHTQADQIRHVIVDTHDDDFYHLPLDPRDGSDRLLPGGYHQSNTQGVGVMYRVIDVPAIFDLLGGRDFGGQTCTLRLAIDDSFLPENAGSALLRFEAGHLRRLEHGEHDVEIRLAIEDFSSLLAGTVAFRSLYRYSRAAISDPRYVETVTRLFAVEQKPVCMTHF